MFWSLVDIFMGMFCFIWFYCFDEYFLDYNGNENNLN